VTGRLLKALALILLLVPCSGCGPAADGTLDDIAAPHRFSILEWETKMLPAELGSWLADDHELSDTDTAAVLHYFTLGENLRVVSAELQRVAAGSAAGDSAALADYRDELKAARAELADRTAAIIARQIAAVLTEQGIIDPFANLETASVFPPVSFVLRKPPCLLVVSPRERIMQERTLTLTANLTTAQKDGIESRVDALGYSSLVVNLGGIGATYPALVSDGGSLGGTIDIAVEEWLHQYLAFKPLGRAYLAHLLDISRDPDIVTLNETLAGIVSREIGGLVMAKYYPELVPAEENGAADPEGFDFNREMRQTRRRVDDMLARGEIAAAEAYMESRRQYIVSHGYYIRKLNQAYFAFHGSYADRPTAIDPIGEELKELRTRYDALRDYLAVAAELRSRAALGLALNQAAAGP